MTVIDWNKASMLHHLEGCPRGRFVLYHVGYLYEDRLKNRRLNLMAHAVYAEQEAKRVCLVQKKLGKWQYEYFAVKR